MTYYSTRDPHKRPVSFREAVLSGLAPDGGLYVPATVPRLDPGWRDATSLAEVGLHVLTPWLDDELSGAQLKSIVQDALEFSVPLVQLDETLAVLELFHGPTLSFKDVGARTMARLLNAFLAGEGERLTILVATSGDTGSAVADGFAGQDNIEVVLLYPKGMVSEVQERQLVAPRPGVRAYAVAGDFDACQRLVKDAFVDPELRELGLSSANSINLGRLLPQSSYYLWAALQAEAMAFGGAGFGEIGFCVPSGNLGNVTAGVLASRMGLDAPRFVVGHNANDFFPGFLDAHYGPDGFKKTVPTLSNAMDVGAPSNFERLYALLGGEAMRGGELWGTSVSDDVTKARLRHVYEQYAYVACPHTAVGLEAAARYREATGDDTPMIVLATAHPAKFADAVGAALGLTLPPVEALEALKGPELTAPELEPTLSALKTELLARA